MNTYELTVDETMRVGICSEGDILSTKKSPNYSGRKLSLLNQNQLMFVAWALEIKHSSSNTPKIIMTFLLFSWLSDI